jgi:UDP-GlcNAc:undecaprenyl-phosphate GlcNAc-1-phosphate transferase
MLFPHLVTLAVAFVLTSVLIPLVTRVAIFYKLLDHPDGDRRLHRSPIPRLGGVAIFISTGIALAVSILWDRLDASIALPLSPLLPGILIGAVIVACLGLVDDLVGVRPSIKLTSQTIAAFAVIAYGFRIDTLSFGGTASLALGPAAVPLTVFWIVGITNAFNLIDGVDGLAGVFALIAIAASSISNILLHGPSVMLLSAAMFGSVLAFLRYNKSPARIFLGDSGSMTLGFVLAIRTVSSATAPTGSTYALIPLFALAFPIADTLIAIARRWIRDVPSRWQAHPSPDPRSRDFAEPNS